MKTCKECGEAGPLADFYAHPGMKDGHFNHCKPCDVDRLMAAAAYLLSWQSVIGQVF